MRKLKRYLAKYTHLVILALLVLPAIFSLFRPGFFTMHDDQQVVRLYELDRALAAGQFPARWVGNLGFGYGYPLFIFYPPLVYYLAEIFHLLLGASFIVSIKLVFALAFLGAAFAMYIWAEEHFGKTAALIAAAFYTYAPYHAVDAYVRGSLAELTSFVWLPVILWSADRLIQKKQKQYWILMGIFLALLMITHNLIFLSFFPLFLIYLGSSILRAKDKRLAIRPLLFALISAFALSAFFWLPALVERKQTLVDNILLADLAEYELHFVYPSQLWNSLWGYGGSTEGLLDGLSFKIGKLHVVLAILAPILWFIVSRFKQTRESKNLSFYSFILLFLFSVSAFMTTAFSQPIWKYISSLQYLQFPWRFLTFTAVFSSFLAGSTIAVVKSLTKNIFVTLALAVVTLILLFYPNLKLFKPQTYLDVKDDYYLTDEFLKWKISKTSFEFVPKGVKTKMEWNEVEQKEITQVDISRNQIARTPYTILSGEGEVEVKHNMSGLLILKTKSDQPMLVQLSIFDFSGWEVSLNEEKVAYDSDNNLKLITAKLPAGEHQLRASFKNTPIRSVANLISLASIATMSLLGIKRLKEMTS